MAESPLLDDRHSEARRLLNGYVKYLKRRKQGENEPGSHIAIHDVQDVYELEKSDPNHALQLAPDCGKSH